MDASQRIADFSDPPITEVVLGLQFERLESLTAAHHGLFWNSLRAQYPHVRDDVPLPVLVEGQKDEDGEQGMTRFHARTLMEDAARSRLLQIQDDRFHHNWKKTKGEAYPKYDEIRGSFLNMWQAFEAFCSAEGIGTPTPTQYEMTYQNQIEEGDDAWHPVEALAWFDIPRGADVGASIRLDAAECAGNLYFTATSARRKTDGKQLIILELTLRGRPTAEHGGLGAWCDRARRRIVETFLSCTTDSARARWGQAK